MGSDLRATELSAWLLDELERDEGFHAGGSTLRLEASCTKRWLTEDLYNSLDLY